MRWQGADRRDPKRMLKERSNNRLEFSEIAPLMTAKTDLKN